MAHFSSTKYFKLLFFMFFRILALGEDDAGTSLRAAALRVCLSSSSESPILHGERLQKDLSDLRKKMSRKTVTLDQIRNVTFSKDVREVRTVLLLFCILDFFCFASIMIFINVTPLNYTFIILPFFSPFAPSLPSFFPPSCSFIVHQFLHIYLNPSFSLSLSLTLSFSLCLTLAPPLCHSQNAREARLLSSSNADCLTKYLDHTATCASLKETARIKSSKALEEYLSALKKLQLPSGEFDR